MDPNYTMLVEQLGAPLQELKDRARRDLVAAGEDATPALITALQHSERDVRAGACLALAELRAGEAAGPLARLAVSDPESSVRPLALRALAALADPGCPPEVRRALLEQVSSDDMFARAQACTGLARIGDTASVEAITTARRDPEQWVREAAEKALLAINRQAQQPAVEASRLPVKVTNPVTETGLTPLARGLQSINMEVQQFAQKTLIERGARSVPEIVPVLLAGPPEGRRAAAEVLGSLGAPEGMPHLHQLLVQDDLGDDLRATTLHCMAGILRKSGSLESFPGHVVLDLLHHSRDHWVRGGAASALVAGGGSCRRLALEAMDEEDEQWVMLQAGKALDRSASPADAPLIPLIITFLSSVTEVEGQVTLLGALARIAGRPSELSRQLVGPVSFFLRSKVEVVRRAAASVLVLATGQLDRRSQEVIVGLIEEHPRECVDLVRALGRLAHPEDPLPLATIRRLLLNPDPSVSSAAVATLASMGGVAAVDALVKVANSHAGQVVATAAQALAALDPDGEVVAVRLPDGKWQRQLNRRCHCGGQLRWVERQGREELRCPQCDAEYLLSLSQKMFPADRTPFGACLCTGCRRKRPLVRQGDSEVLVCPHSGKLHIRPFDHPRQLRLLEQLQFGACSCCDEPQPLVRVNEQVLCYRSRRQYRPAARGFELADAPRGEVQDVAAINRALLMGTLSLAESGVTADSDDE